MNDYSDPTGNSAQPPEIPAELRNASFQPSTSNELVAALRSQLRRVVFGQDQVIDQVIACFLAGGHVLLEGKPGLGKTHMVVALANTFGGAFSRIQFTPDLMPSDVTGFTLFDMKSQTFQIRRGAVFTNLLLADEINRAPAKTQSALLEVMQERQVTIDGETIKLDAPFMTLATQNPIEQEGTYPLPEAQLDRFLMKVVIDYPSLADEAVVVQQVTNGAGLSPQAVDKVCSSEEVTSARQEVATIRCVEEVVNYALNIVRATRGSQGISLGAGTRGAISLVSVAKAYAFMAGRDFVTPNDIKSAALPVLRHRVQLAPELAISGRSVDDAIISIVAGVEAPRQ